MGLTIDDVLKDLPKAPPALKTAGANLQIPHTHAGYVRKLAELLRDPPEPQITWESLYAVKQAGYRRRLQADIHLYDAEKGGRGAPLRKLATAVRNLENQQAVAFFEKNATALKAIRGLTLLREKVAL